MSRVLLVDTNRAAYPIYQALNRLGHEVWVVGANPDETLAKLAANYIVLDYSDKDSLSELVSERGFDYLVPGCTDLSYQVCAEINDGRFPGIDTVANTRKINAKDEFRKVSAELAIPIPRVLTAAEALASESVIVKPVDAFSGRGISVLHKPTEASLASVITISQQASKTGKVIIEEFVDGQLYSFSCFLRNGEVVADFIVQEDCIANPFAVDTSRLAVDFSKTIHASLRADIIRFSSALQLVDGLIHAQFILRDDRYWIIEVTRRCPGDIYSLLIELSTNYRYAMNYLAPFVGQEADFPDENVSLEPIVRHTVTSREGTPLWGFRFSCPVDIRLFVPLATAGDYIKESPDGRAGIFFFGASSWPEQEAIYRKLLADKLYQIS